ncbi:hypothetical protein SPHINGO391_350073 [Sphingomonas aurantiaca]|uniref:Uncharacterized protein n=1 Tax=Sphingomonas aurantiaca TaxID=185949 RepID=A0A5E7Y4V0_9SPHN|nr:hypothetical protein SPHINGO391_350073 [Sphingomonas aurantiaca]
MAGVSLTEGEAGDHRRSVSSPSDACGATSPWRGRIFGGRRYATGTVHMRCAPIDTEFHLHQQGR